MNDLLTVFRAGVSVWIETAADVFPMPVEWNDFLHDLAGRIL